MFEDLLRYSNTYATGKVNSVPKEIITKKEFKLELLRAFFEDEGSISFNGRIMADLKDGHILEQLRKILEEFELGFRMCSYKVYTGTMYKIYLPKNLENLQKFYNLKLFDKSIITHGKNACRKKADVLIEILEKLKKAQANMFLKTAIAARSHPAPFRTRKLS